MIENMQQTLQDWLYSDGSSLVMGAYASILIGHFGTTALLEMVIRFNKDVKLIEYKGPSDRRKDIDKTFESISWTDQFQQGVWSVCGPINILGCLISSILFNGTSHSSAEFWPSSWTVFWIHALALSLITDLGVYLGHRLQHEITFLYEQFHALHHTVRTTVPVSAGFVDSFDAIFVVVLPLFVAIAIIPVQRFTMFAFLAFFAFNAVVDHSGIDEWWLDIIALRFLPFRCPSWWHDAHHRFGIQNRHTKNYGVVWTIWDILGGTAWKPEGYNKMRKERPHDSFYDYFDPLRLSSLSGIASYLVCYQKKMRNES